MIILQFQAVGKAYQVSCIRNRMHAESVVYCDNHFVLWLLWMLLMVE